MSDFTLARHVPDRWERGQLGDFCEMYQPRTISTKELITDGEFPVYGANGQIGFYNAFNHSDSEVTVTCRGATCGTVNVIPARSWITGNAMVVRPLRDCMTKDYLNHVLRSLDFTNVITGTAQPQITRTTLTTIEIPVAPLAEQEKIVEILEEQLSRLDAALEAVRAVRVKAAQFRRSLLHAAFTGALTGHDTSTGAVPDSWAISSIGQIGTVKGGKRLPKGTPWSPEKTDHPYIRATDIKNGKINEAGLVYVPNNVWESIKRYIVNAGDIVISIAGTIGSVAVVPESLAHANLTENAAKITNLKGLNPDFLAYFLRAPTTVEGIERLSTSTTQAKLALFRIESISVPIPPEAEQEKIVEILEEQLSRLDASLAVANTVEKRAAALRRSLLHAAFTGNLTKQWRENAHV